MPTIFNVEVTDTFGGEANYSWVRRYEIEVNPKDSDLALMRRAKAIAGFNGVRGRTFNHGEVYEFRPYGACMVMYVSYKDNPHAD